MLSLVFPHYCQWQSFDVRIALNYVLLCLSYRKYIFEHRHRFTLPLSVSVQIRILTFGNLDHIELTLKSMDDFPDAKGMGGWVL